MPLNDILNCAEADLWELLDADDAYEQEGWFFCKGIGMIELCKLGEILGVASYDELMDGFQLIGEPRDEGPWPQTLPPSLVARLKVLTDADITAVVPKWAEIEELAGTASEESLADYLKSFQDYLASRSGAFFMVCGL